MSMHVCIGLPDGRKAVADYRQPIVAEMDKINRLIMEHSSPRLNSGQAPAAAIASYQKHLAVVAGWLDHHPEQACSSFPDESKCTHPAATSEPHKRPRRYTPDWD